MGALKQLGLVLWKAVVLRKRQPVIFFLELIWPVLIFLIVVLVRREVPPVQKTECHYAPRAMPTAGFTFLQDYACNLDNNCYASEVEANAARTQSDAASFMQVVSPLYAQRENTQNFLEKLPETKKVLDTLTDTLESPEVKELLDFDPVLRNFFRDPEKVTNYLVNEAKVLSKANADALMGATVNVSKLFELAGNTDFKGIVCSPEQLKQYLDIPCDESCVEAVSESLCNINDSLVGGITEFLQQQLDISEIIKLAQKLESDYDTQVLLEDLLQLIEIVSNLNGTQSLLGGFDAFEGLIGWGERVMNLILRIISNPNDMANLQLIGTILNDVQPLLSSILGNDVDFSTLVELFGYINNVSDVLNGNGGDASGLDNLPVFRIFSSADGLQDMLAATYNLSMSDIEMLGNLSFDVSKLSEYMTSAMAGNITYPLCEEPGLINLFVQPDNETMMILHDLQDMICNGNNTEQAIREIGNVIDVDTLLQLMRELQSNNTGSFDISKLLDSLIPALTMPALESLVPLLGNQSVEELYRSIATGLGMLMNGSFDSLDGDELGALLTMFAGSMGGSTGSREVDMFMYMTWITIDIMNLTEHKLVAFGSTLEKVLTENENMRMVLDSLMQLDPDMTPEIMASLLDPVRLQAQFWNTTTPNVDVVFCDPTALSEFLGLDTSAIDINSLSGILCNKNLTSVLEEVMQQFTFDDIQMKVDEMLAVLEGRMELPIVTSEVISQQINALIMDTSEEDIQKNVIEGLNRIMPLLNSSGSLVMTDDWTMLGVRLTQSYAASVGGSLMEVVGEQLEASPAWFSVSGIVMSTVEMLQAGSGIVEFFSMMQDPTTEIGKATEAILMYLPELLYEIGVLATDQTVFSMFIQEVTVDPMGVLCSYDKMSQYLDPIEQLPLQSLQEQLCSMNMPLFTETISMSTEKLAGHLAMAINAIFNSSNGTSMEPMDWRYVYNLGNDVSMEVQRWISDPSQFSLWYSFDYNRMLAGINFLFGGMLAMDNSSMAMPMPTVEQYLQGYLGQLNANMFAGTPEDTEMLRYYMYAIDEYVKLMNALMETDGGNSLRLSDVFADSQWLQNRLTDYSDALPEFTASLGNAFLDPQQLILMLTSVNFNGTRLCDQFSVTDLFTVQNAEDVRQLERVLCGVDMNVLNQEILNSAQLDGIDDVIYMLQNYNTSLVPNDYVMNMTQTVMELSEMMTNSFNGFSNMGNDTTFSMDMLFNQILGVDWNQFNVNGLNASAMDIISQVMGTQLAAYVSTGGMGTNVTLVELFGSLMPVFTQVMQETMESLLSSSIPGADGGLRYYMYAANKFALYSKKYLQTIGENGISLGDILANSTWLNQRVNETRQAWPDAVDSLNAAMVQPEQLIALLTSTDLNGTQLCTNISLSEIIKLPNDLASVQQLENLLCGTDTMALTEELLNSGLMVELQDMIHLFQYFKPDLVPDDYVTNLTEVTANFLDASNILTMIASDSDIFMDLLNGLTTELMGDLNFTGIESLASNLMDQLMGMDLNSASQWLTMSSMLIGNDTSPQIQMAFTYLDALVEVHLRSLQVIDMEHLKAMYPSIAWYRHILNGTPYVLKVAIEEGLQQGQTQKLAVVTSAELFCNASDLSQLITLPPDSEIDEAELQRTLCELNETAIRIELLNMYNYLMEPFLVFQQPNPTSDVNLTVLMSKIGLLEREYSKVNNFSNEDVFSSILSVFQWINGDVWVSNFNEILNFTVNQFSSQNPADYAILVPQLEVLGQMANISALNGPLNFFNAVLGELNTKLSLLNANSSLVDMFPNSPETAKLAKMVEKFPYIFELLGKSYDKNVKFQSLVMNPNMTEVFLILCHPQSDFHSYFTIPNNWADQGINIDDLRAEFCAVDITLLESEGMIEFNIPYITNQFTNMAPVDWTLLFNQLNSVLAQLGAVLSSPPMEFANGAWIDGAIWINILNSYSNEQYQMNMMTNMTMDGTMESSIDSILINIINSQVNTLKSLLDPPSAAALDELMSSINTMIVTLNQQLLLVSKPNLSIYDIFADSPEILAFLSPSEDVTGLTDALLKIPLANPTTLLALMNETPVTLCAQPLSYYKDNFQINDDATAEGLRNLMCNLDAEAWNIITAELGNKIGLAAIMDYFSTVANGTNNMTATTGNTTFDWSILNANIEEFTTNLLTLFGSSPQYDIPSFNTSLINNTLTKVYMNTNATNYEEITRAVMAVFGSFYGTEIWDEIVQYQSSFDVVISYLNDMLSLLEPGQNGAIDIQMLFGNSTEWKRVLSSSLNAGSELNLDMYQFNIRTEMIEQLVTLNESSLAALLCSEEEFQKYFVYPPSVNVSHILEATCGIDTALLMDELNTQFDLAGLMNAIVNPPNNTDFDIEAMVSRYQRFIEDIMTLGSITNVTFFGNTVGQFMNIDPSTIIPMDPAILMMGANAQYANISTMSEAFDAVFETLTTTLTQLGTIPQDAGYNAFLRMLNTAMTMAIDQLNTARSGSQASLDNLLTLNNSDIQAILQTSLGIQPDITSLLLQTPIPVELMLYVIETNNVSALQHYFCTTNLTSMPVQGNQSISDLQRQICSLDFNAVWENIQSSIDLNKWLPDFMQLFNYTDAQITMFNWTEYAQSVAKWNELFQYLVGDEPITDILPNMNGFETMFSPDSVNDMLSVFMNQYTNVTTLEQSFSLAWQGLIDGFAAQGTVEQSDGYNAFLRLFDRIIKTTMQRLNSSTNGNVFELSALLGNIPEVNSVLGMQLPPEVITALLQAPIPTDVLLTAASGNMTALQNFFCNGNISEWLNMPAGGNYSVDDIQIQLCTMDYDLLWESIKDYINYDSLYPEFMKLVNATYDPSQSSYFNWTAYALNVGDWQALLNTLMDEDPQLGDSLTGIADNFDADMIINMLSGLLQEEIITQYLNNTLGNLGGSFDEMNVAPRLFAVAFNNYFGRLTKNFKKIQDDGFTFGSIAANSAELAKSFSESFYILYSVASEVLPETTARDIFERLPENAPDYRSTVCSTDILRAVLENYVSPLPLYWDVDKISSVMCTWYNQIWYDQLLEHGFAMEDIYYIATILGKHYNLPAMSQDELVPFNPTSTIEMFTQIIMELDDLDAYGRNFSSEGEWEDWVMSVAMGLSDGGAQATIPVQILSLRMMDMMIEADGMSASLMRESVHTLAFILDYTNARIADISNGTYIQLMNLFPDELSVRAQLSSVLSTQAVNDLLALSMEPAIIPYLTNATAWEELVCDENSFLASVNTSSVSDLSGLLNELCTAASNGENVMEMLMGLVDFNVFIAQVSQQPMDLTQNPYSYLESQLYMLQHNIAVLSGKELDGMEQWLSVFNQSLEQTMMNATMGGLSELSTLTSMCSQTLGMLDQALGGGLIAQSLQMNLEYMEMYIQLLQSYPSIVELTCGMTTNNLTETYRIFQESSLIEIINQAVGIFVQMNDSSEPEASSTSINCAEYMDTITRYTQIATEFYASDAVTLTERMSQCLMESADQSLPALADVDQIISLMNEVREILESMPDLEQILPFVDGIIANMVQQQSVTMMFSEMLQNITSFEELMMNGNFSIDVLNMMLGSALDISLSNVWNLSVEQLEAIVCDPQALADYFHLPDMVYDVTAISTELCASNISALLTDVKGSIDIGRIFYELSQNIPQYILSSDWLTQLTSDINNVTAQSLDLMGFADLMQNFDIEKLLTELPKLMNFINSGGIEQFIESVKKIVADIGAVLPPDEMTEQMFKDIQILLDAIKGLQYFQRLNVQVMLREVVQDPYALEDYLKNTLGLTDEVTQALLYSSISYVELLNLTQRIDIENLVCNPDNLATILSLNNSDVDTGNDTTLGDISTELCAMGVDQVVELVEFLQYEVDIGKIVEVFITINPTQILEDNGVNIEELQETLAAFKPLQQTFQQFAAELEAIPESVLASAAALKAGGNSDEDSVKALSNLMCGRDNAFNIADDLQLGSDDDEAIPETAGNEPEIPSNSSARRKKRQTSGDGCSGNGWSDWQMYEMSRMRTPFCEDMYKSLQCNHNGRIIWSFLKPLLMGRIPFTPDTPITRAIMAEATSIFTDVDQLASFAKTFVDSASSIGEFSDSTDQIKILEDALRNPFISQAVYDIVGVNPNDLTAQLKSLSSIDKRHLDAMVTVSELVYNASQCVYQYRSDALPDEAILVKQAQYHAARNELLAGIVFMDISDSEDQNGDSTNNDICSFKQYYQNITIPDVIKFKIRMSGENVLPTDRTRFDFWMPGPEDNFADRMRYFRGFIQLQDLIENSIIKLQSGCEGEMPKLETKQFPYPCYEEDLFSRYVTLYMFPVMMVLAMLVFVGSSIRNIVYDKEHRLEEAMAAMGMKAGVNWLGWFLSTFVLMLIIDAIIVLFLKFGNLYRFTDAGLIFVFLAVFSFSLITMCYLISVFFFRTTLAALVGLLVYLCSYIPYIVLANMHTELEFWQSILACLSSTTAFSFGTQMFSHMEQRGVGLQWSDVTSDNIYTNFTFAWSFYMMLIDSAIYLFLGLYLRNIIPGKYGISQPWYFPFSPTYWGCGSCGDTSSAAKYKTQTATPNIYGEGSVQGSYTRTPDPSLTSLPNNNSRVISSLTSACVGGQHGSDYNSLHSESTSTSLTSLSGVYISRENSVSAESDPHNLPVGISLHNLTKSYDSCCGTTSKGGVKNLSVNFYQEHITAFLGQNGAGKTTAINMLSGILQPSSGTAFINNNSIRDSMGKIRGDLGICPQRDTLFEYLTVYEHLEFFASIKGKQSKREMKEDISRMLDLTGLVPSKSVKVSQLSGGQRRRLSVALAFIGGSSVVILDEPTSGIDSCARRSIWDLIIQNRPGRTIVISTHHLDEADVLSDRIVLMHKGQVLCTGSPLYLKSQYGSGYQLTMSKQASAKAPHYENAADSTGGSVESGTILQFLVNYVPDARLVEEVGTELTYMLPTHTGQLARFSEMFNVMENQKSSLGIDSYGVSDTTLEEVFLKLTKTADDGLSLDPVKVRETYVKNSDNYKKSKKLEETGLTNGIERPTSETTKNKPFALTQIKALFYKRFWHHLRDYRSYLSQIICPILFICLAMGMSAIVPTNTDLPQIQLSPEVLYPNTFAFYRLENNDVPFKSYESVLVPEYSTEDWTMDRYSVPSGSNNKYANPGECSCDRGSQICPEGAKGLPNPYHTSDTGIKWYNLTGNQFSVEEYLSRTLNDFFLERYGGFQFKEIDNEKQAVVWYNNKGWHALPSYQNALSNAILRARMSNSTQDQGDYGIEVYNHPLPKTKDVITQETLTQSIAENGLAIIIICAFSFVPAGYTIFIISERVNKEKRLQFIYGINSLLYWTTAFIWDLITYSFSVALAVAVAYAFQIDTYTNGQNLAAFTVSLCLFGWSCIPLMYIVCRVFKDVSIGYMTVFLLNFLIGVSTVVCTFLVSLFMYKEEIKDAYYIMNHVFKIFPQYCLGDSLIRLSTNEFQSRVLLQFNIDSYVNPFSFDKDYGVGYHYIAMGIQGLVFFVLTLLLEIRCLRTRGVPNPKAKPPKPSSLKNGNKDLDYKEDSDVSLERQRVITGDARNDTLVLHNMRKMYRRGLKTKVLAVDNVTLGVPKGECFGLLGVNGAGKTTTFNMMTGETQPSAGGAILNGLIISEDVGNMNGEVGYCPQNDALDDFLTGRELLYFYASLKGVPHMKHAINGLIDGLGLRSHIGNCIKSYSGGTKRKLSTAIALLGNPKLVLLDEPTTGMDAGSRRLVWDKITELVKSGTSVLLTSHSMSECDALCTRMGIMVNGRFMCLGNGQHLKTKYGTGYTVVTRVSGIPPDLQAVINFMKDTFHGAELKESHLNQLQFEIPLSSASLGQIFGRLEADKSWLHLQEYSVSQPTLDQVFVNFARCQNDGTDENNLDIEEGGHIKAYTNQAYGVIGTPTTPVLPHHRASEVRKSLNSYPEEEGSDKGSDIPSTSTGSGTHSPASTLPMKSRPQSSEVTIINPDTGAVEENNVTIVQF